MRLQKKTKNPGRTRWEISEQRSADHDANSQFCSISKLNTSITSTKV